MPRGNHGDVVINVFIFCSESSLHKLLYHEPYVHPLWVNVLYIVAILETLSPH